MLFNFALLAAVLMAAVAVTAVAGAPRDCTDGSSSIGPAVLTNGHLNRAESNLKPHTTACHPNKAG